MTVAAIAEGARPRSSRAAGGRGPGNSKRVDQLAWRARVAPPAGTGCIHSVPGVRPRAISSRLRGMTRLRAPVDLESQLNLSLMTTRRDRAATA